MKVIKEEFSCLRDGLTIRGKLYRPEGEGLAAVILSHGYMGSHRQMEHYAISLAQRGHAALCYDFCGGSRRGISDGDTTQMTVLSEVEDLIAVFGYTRGLEYVDKSRIYLMGSSQGGFVSGIAAARLQDEVAGAILCCPALCIPDDARSGRMLMSTFDPNNVPERISCGGDLYMGKDYVLTAQQMDPYEMLEGYMGPVLIVHGTDDKVVNYSYAVTAAERYAARFDKPDGRSQFLTLPGGDHGFLPGEDQMVLFAVEQLIAGRSEVLTIDVRLFIQLWELEGDLVTRHLMFRGGTEGRYFKGSILPGAEDTQIFDGERPVSMCADYRLQGQDYSGKDCTVHIVNRSSGREWTPTLETDSQALSFLNGARCKAYLENRREGPIVHIYTKVPQA